MNLFFSYPCQKWLISRSPSIVKIESLWSTVMTWQDTGEQRRRFSELRIAFPDELKITKNRVFISERRVTKTINFDSTSILLLCFLCSLSSLSILAKNSPLNPICAKRLVCSLECPKGSICQPIRGIPQSPKKMQSNLSN